MVLVAGVAVTATIFSPGSDRDQRVLAAPGCAASTPSLVNGSFESLPSLPTSQNEDWQDFNGGNPPDQFLLVKDTAQNDQILGWRTTASDDYIEIQRQVAGYEQDGTDSASGYWDRKAPQPGDGSYWGELNAYEASALYQDIEAVAGQTYYWSLLHRGRVFSTPDQMRVLIGPPGSLVQETSIWKFSPQNADKFVGVPTYGATGVSVSTISTTLEDGWTKYQGAHVAAANGPLRFQFEAVTASFQNRVGNLLDGITFSIFETCDSSRNLEVGQMVSVDITDPEFVNGSGHSLTSAVVVSGSSGTIVTNGSNVEFTGVEAGVTVVRYTVEAVLNGSVVTRTGLVTYTVNAPPTTSTTSTTTTTTTTVPMVSTSSPSTGQSVESERGLESLPSTGWRPWSMVVAMSLLLTGILLRNNRAQRLG